MPLGNREGGASGEAESGYFTLRVCSRIEQKGSENNRQGSYAALTVFYILYQEKVNNKS